MNDSDYTVWVLLCIVVGIALSQLFAGPFQAIGRMEISKVNLPVGLLLGIALAYHPQTETAVARRFRLVATDSVT